MNFDPLKQSLAERIVITAIIVIAVILLLAIIGWAMGRWEVQAQPQPQPMVITLPATKWDAKMLELDKQALDEAYVNKIKQLFDVWVREGLSSPEGPMKGHAQAQRAYIYGQQSLEIREKVMEERALK